MKIGKRKISGFTAALLISLIAVSAAFATYTILFTLNVPGTWQVQTAYGLQLSYPNGTQVSAISFTTSPLGSTTETFNLTNVGNDGAVNVTQAIPNNLVGVYGFTTTFVNGTTIARQGSYQFTVTLTDYGMDSTQQYSGNFVYNIVTGNPSGGSPSDTFGTTSVTYASDTAQYFAFQSDSFNASSYPAGSTVLYSFTTQNINASYEIQGISYTLQVLDAGNNVISTPANGLLVAYYQDANDYGTFGNSTHLTDQPLLPGESMTIWNAFTAPSVAGTYHLALTYEGHNAAAVPAPITWTTNISNNDPADLSVQVQIQGAQASGQQGNVSITLTPTGDALPEHYDLTISVPQLSLTILPTTELTFNDYSQVILSYPFTPSSGGALTMQITLQQFVPP